MSSESFRTWLGNYHLTYLQAWLLGPHGVTFTEITDDIWWPLKCYINQNASLSLLSYHVNQWATWLVFRKGQADHFTNEWQGFSSERISEEGQGMGMGRTRTMKPSLVLIQVLEATEKLSTPGTYHRWSVRNTRSWKEAEQWVSRKRKIITTITSHIMDLGFCLQEICMEMIISLKKTDMENSWPDEHWHGCDVGLHIYLQNTM